jgi:tetratricopeptide (TPR) repeat protein
MTATILHNLGGLHHARGRFDLAEEPSRRAWKMRRRLLGANHPTTLADATAYAAVLDRLGRYGESLPIYELALDFYERTFGPEHYETAATLHNLALVERAAGHHARAEKLARRALDIKTKLLGATHPDTALSALNLAAMLIPSQPEAAELLLQGALAVLTRALAPDHPHVIRCRQLLEGLRNADHHPKREALR